MTTDQRPPHPGLDTLWRSLRSGETRRVVREEFTEEGGWTVWLATIEGKGRRSVAIGVKGNPKGYERSPKRIGEPHES